MPLLHPPVPETGSEAPLLAADHPRVLMVLKRALGSGGMQKQAIRVTLRMRERGVPVSILTLRSEKRLIPHWAGDLPAEAVPGGSQIQFAGGVYRYLLRRRSAYDVVHVHGMGPEAFAAILARRATGKPVVVKPSTAGPGTKLHALGGWTAALPFLRSSLWRQVDAWVCISRQTRDDVLRLGVDPARIAFVPNGVDTSAFSPLPPAERLKLRNEFGLAPDDVVFCAACRLSPHKRVDLLVRAFLDLAPRFPPAKLWVLGRGEQLWPLRELTNKHPHGSQVSLFGHVKADQVVRRFQAVDAFALVSLWEGLSNSLLEAMACGLPAVVTNVSGMADVVREGVHGLLVPPDDEAAVSRAVTTLLQAPERRRALGEAAAEQVRRRFGLETTVDRLLRVYAACRAGEPAPVEFGAER